MAKHFAPGAQLPDDENETMPAAGAAGARPAVPDEGVAPAGEPVAAAGPESAPEPSAAAEFEDGATPNAAVPEDAAAPDDSAEWPSLDEVPRRRRRHHKRRGRVLKVLGVIVVVLALAAGGAAWAIQSSIERGRQAFQESMQKTIEQNANTVQYNGKSYALNEHMVTVAFIGFDNRTTNETTGEATEGQSDTVIVVALNTDTGEATAIVIPRDSMVPVDMYVDGNYTGQSTMQICLQYSYGSTPEQSSELVAQCASRVLDGIPIDYYFTLNVEGVGPINDSIGGVTLVPTQTVQKANVTEGDEVTLMGKSAEYYVQYRDITDPDSSLKRQKRQISYLQAFSSKVLQTAKSNPALIVDLYQTADDYTWTNLGVDEVSFLGSTMLGKGVTDFNVVSLQGTMGAGDKHAEFTLDQDSVYQTVIDTFYHEVGNGGSGDR